MVTSASFFNGVWFTRQMMVTLLLIVVYCTSISLSSWIPVRINLTGSMPQGLYGLTNKSPALNDWVTVCLPMDLAQLGLMRHYIHRGSCANGSQPLLKQVVAVAGDTVAVNHLGVWINARLLPHSSTQSDDSNHHHLPHISPGIYHLTAGQLWLYGTDSTRSWDSRYFGVANSSWIIGVVHPLIIFNGER